MWYYKIYCGKIKGRIVMIVVTSNAILTYTQRVTSVLWLTEDVTVYIFPVMLVHSWCILLSPSKNTLHFWKWHFNIISQHKWLPFPVCGKVLLGNMSYIIPSDSPCMVTVCRLQAPTPITQNWYTHQYPLHRKGTHINTLTQNA